MTFSESTVKTALKQWRQNPTSFCEDALGDSLWDKQKEVLDSIRDNQYTVVRSGHGVGKCLGKNTEVLMADGSVGLVQDIVDGDKVMGPDGNKRVVMGCVRGFGKLYRVSYSDGSYYMVNEDHIISLVASNSKGTQKTGAITNVSIKDYLSWGKNKKRTNIGYKTKVNYPKKNLKINPYLLGTWLGDGDSHRSGITTEDEEVLLAWQQEANARNLTFRKEKNSNIQFHITSGMDGRHDSNSLLNDLKELSLIKNKHIPQIYKASSIEQRLELLAGLIDTDGHLTHSGYEITQKNKTLAKDIQRLAQSVGCHATINECFKSCTYNGHKKIGIYYRVFITRNINQIPCRLERKKANIKNEQRKNLHFKINVEFIGEGDYYGFELIGKDRLFLLGDYTVTHNTFIAARAVIWFLSCFHPAKVITTAPTWNQVKNVLWTELARAYRNSKVAIGGELFQTSLRLSDDHFAAGFSTNDPDKFQGHHSPHIMVVFDEAPGVAPEIWEASKGLLSSGHSRFLAIGNPTSPTGMFYDAFKNRLFNKIAISCYDSPNIKEGKVVTPGLVSHQWIEDMKQEWGENSPIFKSRVLGEFPIEGEDTLIPLTWVERAIDKQIAPEGKKTLGIDVARFGSDSTVFVVMHGRKVIHVQGHVGNPTTKTAGIAVQLFNEYGCDRILVDDVGVGGGVCDILVEQRLPVVGVNFGDKAKDSERFYNLKAEIFWNLRDEFANNTIDIPDHDRFLDELPSLMYEVTSRGQLKIIGKDAMKKLGMKSPDYADALAIAHYGMYDSRMGILDFYEEQYESDRPIDQILNRAVSGGDLKEIANETW